MKKSFSFAVVVCVCVTMFLTLSRAHAQKNPVEDRVDGVFAQWNKPDSPGCALSVMQGGHIIYKHGYGMADLDHDVPITPSSVFHVASMSKQFTAAAIVLLAQQGKLSLDDDIHKYIPEVPDFGVSISLRQMLHHISGLRDQWEMLTFSGWRLNKDLITNEDVLDIVKRQRGLNFQPGEKFEYSNTNFTLLGEVVKRVSGQTLREFTTAHIFQPLGMTHTHFRDDHSEIVKNMAFGYIQAKDKFYEDNTDFDTVGATSLLTTVEDLALWDENFYNPRVGDKAFLETMLQTIKLNNGQVALDGKDAYALALMIGEYRGLPDVNHSGSDAGYKAQLIRFPQQHFSVATLCNLGNNNASGLAHDVADIYLADKMTPKIAAEKAPAKPTAPEFHMTPDQLQEYVADYADPEIEPVYHIALDKDTLVLTWWKRHPLHLRPVGKDEFVVGGMQADRIHFKRDSEGKLTGFVLDGGRSQNLRFTRKKPCG